MAQRTYARIQDGAVAELFETDQPIAALFNPALIWVDVTDVAGIAEGWRYDGSSFALPPPFSAPSAPSPTDLQAQLQTLASQIAALTRA